ncbi:MAG: glycosyltransferase family 1 protein, partial [Rhizobiaceae bacterium]|nr:glycosyltransferase family 1 protein [Rhizobiaceae bacterium]
QRGLNVVHLFGAYGQERDDAIGRAKIVLNMHFYEAAIFEVVRVSYLLANGACVVTEGDADDVDLKPFADGLVIAKLDELADRCVQLLSDDRLRVTTALRGFKAMSSRWQSDLLKPFFEQ